MRMGSRPSQFSAASRTWSKMRLRTGVASAISTTVPATARGVLIEDGRISAILPSAKAGSVGDAQMIDLKGGYLMPGLWDAHIHPGPRAQYVKSTPRPGMA